MLFDFIRLRQCINKFFRNPRRILRGFDFAQENNEFVSSNPAYRIDASHRILHAFRDYLEQLDRQHHGQANH